MEPTDTQKCPRCKKIKPKNAENFAPKKETFVATCRPCLARKAEQRGTQKEAKPDEDPAVTDLNDPAFASSNSVTLGDLLARITEVGRYEELEQITASITLSDAVFDEMGTDRKKADHIAERISSSLKYRFKYHSKYEYKDKPNARFMYHCAQDSDRQDKSRKKEGEDVKNRDKVQMDTFPCHGWLHITLSTILPYALIKINHDMAHTPYWWRDIPEDVRNMVKEHKNSTPDILWSKIRERYPVPQFSRKDIRQLWRAEASTDWKRDEDELKSAQILLEEFSERTESDKNRGLYTVEPVKVHEEEGYSALAFTLPDLLRKWGGKIKEIQIDSAWNTNRSRYEVYAVLGEVFNSGCPLGYLLIQSPKGGSDDEAHRGAKERYIIDLLQHLRDKWDVEPIIKISDKDWSEINALKVVFPEAKHQLCFWHALRTVKTRMATLRRRPAFYNVDEACKEFPFIKPDFLPDAQVENLKSLYTKYPVSQNMVSHLKVRLNGDDSYIDDAEQDQEDGPDYLFEDGEKSVPRSANYTFCPAPHRRQLLRLFTSHFCQHPLFYERHEQEKWTSTKIRTNAVKEMYQFCETRGLREVWAYLWSSWYSPDRWKLWARSTSPLLSRLRTTMGVENFWRQLKHDYLRKSYRPRIDQLVWVLCNRVTPDFYARLATRAKGWRAGRSKELSPFQKFFKRSWKRLEKRAVGQQKYIVDLATWSCNCGQQKYNPFHQCKHLVQAVGTPPIRFWQEIRRRRVSPLYHHAAIQGPDATLTRGTVTDGDDTSDDSDYGQGNISTAPLPKRRRASRGTERTRKRSRTVEAPESSPDFSSDDENGQNDDETAADLIPPIDAGATSSSYYGSDLEDQDDDTYIEEALDIAKDFERAAAIFREQAKNRAILWIRSNKKVGKDVRALVDNIRRHETTGRVAATTWALGGSAAERMGAQNRMGYQPSSPKAGN
ncbi:hypothetical protein D9611_010589 [Ephemerocybe angulata]|uniref:MULE transposase domain-containing protein n=1 Tax=Ephemerocybe angulata TaxID=980116 RepID=A0A8H5BV51_9AGAR|nr:hypothetical protein D9611_010589 [Tulosesus angulatus]